MLIDLAAASVAEKADENSSGKRTGSPWHDILIKGIGGLSELSRRRRSCYGALWLKKAEEGMRSGNLEYDVGYSPSRNRSYVFISAPGDPAKTSDTIADLSLKQMSIRGSKDCVSVAATSTRILSTHLWFYSLIKGENPRGLNVDEILDATISYIKRS